jgi:CspA family cold shock protein
LPACLREKARLQKFHVQRQKYRVEIFMPQVEWKPFFVYVRDTLKTILHVIDAPGRLRGLRRQGALRCHTTQGPSAMAKGIVKWFNSEKGYGFIQPDDGGKDIFVHISAVQQAGLQSLQDNQPIEYELIDGRDGRKSAGDLVV